MDGFLFDFENNDIIIKDDGSFETANIGSQNCALISTSQVCKLTAPEVGEQLAVKILNRKTGRLDTDINKAKRAVERDGGTNVEINITEDQQLTFKADYES